MTVSLAKGGNVSLTKEAGGELVEVLVGLGWDERTTSGDTFDLDASVFVVDSTGKVLGDNWFIFYGNTDSPDGSVHHHGDNLTGAGEGDDEQVTVKLVGLPANAEKIVAAVTIFDAEKKSQSFGQVTNAFIRLVDARTNAELARYDLGEDYSLETAVIFGELYRHGAEWKLRAVGQGYNDGLAGLCRDHGVNVG